MVRKRLAVVLTAGLFLAGLIGVTAASGSTGSTGTTGSTGPSTRTWTMVFGSSGNVGANGVGSVLPYQCELYGVGDYIPSTSCPGLLNTPYELTETPIAATSGYFTYFTVTTTKPAPTTGGNRIVFSIRLCQSATGVCAPGGGITTARCSPAPGSNTCSWTGLLKFNQWVPSGATHEANPLVRDEGLIDIVASRGCSSTCPKGTYNPGNVSWSAAYAVK